MKFYIKSKLKKVWYQNPAVGNFTGSLKLDSVFKTLTAKIVSCKKIRKAFMEPCRRVMPSTY